MVLHEDQGMNETLYAAGSLRAMMALGRVSESCRKSILIASNSLGLYELTNDGPVDTYNINLRLLCQSILIWSIQFVANNAMHWRRCYQRLELMHIVNWHGIRYQNPIINASI
jgi:hypothetical protein